MDYKAIRAADVKPGMRVYHGRKKPQRPTDSDWHRVIEVRDCVTPGYVVIDFGSFYTVKHKEEGVAVKDYTPMEVDTENESELTPSTEDAVRYTVVDDGGLRHVEPGVPGVHLGTCPGVGPGQLLQEMRAVLEAASAYGAQPSKETIEGLLVVADRLHAAEQQVLLERKMFAASVGPDP